MLLTLVGVQNPCVLTLLPAASSGVTQVLRLEFGVTLGMMLTNKILCRKEDGFLRCVEMC